MRFKVTFIQEKPLDADDVVGHLADAAITVQRVYHCDTIDHVVEIVKSVFTGYEHETRVRVTIEKV